MTQSGSAGVTTFGIKNGGNIDTEANTPRHFSAETKVTIRVPSRSAASRPLAQGFELPRHNGPSNSEPSPVSQALQLPAAHREQLAPALAISEAALLDSRQAIEVFEQQHGSRSAAAATNDGGVTPFRFAQASFSRLV